MLKYGSISNSSNGSSKNLLPRNLTFRNSTSSGNGVSTGSSLSDASNLASTTSGDVISATSGDFVKLTTILLNADVIKKKTSTKKNIFLNDNVFISNSEYSDLQTYAFDFGENSNFYSLSLSLTSPILEITDNVVKINATAKSAENYSFTNILKNDRCLSGFSLPNFNETDGDLIDNNVMLVMPSNYYLDYNVSRSTLGFTKFNNNYYFGNDTKSNNIRFSKTSYPFNKDNTDFNNTFDFTNDATINSISAINNLLNIEVKNIAMGNGDIVLLNNLDFNPSNPNNVQQSKSFNFKVWDVANPVPKNIFKLNLNKGTFDVPELEFNENISVNNITVGQPKLLFQKSDDFYIGRKNKENPILGDLDFIQFNYDPITNTGRLVFLVPVDISGGSQGVSLIGNVLDFSGNGEAYFADNLNFNSNNIPIVTFNKNFVNIKPNINLTGQDQIIKFSPGFLRFIDISSNRYLELNSVNKNVRLYQPLDLSSNGIIQLGTALNFQNNGNTLISIKPTSFDISSNTFVRLANANIKFTTQLTFADQFNNNYLAFDGNSQSIKIMKPLDFSGNGIIKTDSSLTFASSTADLFRVTTTSFDISSNLNFLNPDSLINLGLNGKLSFVDYTGFNYIILDSVTQTVKFFKPIEFGSAQSAIKFNTNLDFVNISNTVVASFDQDALSLNGGIVFTNNSFIQISSGNLYFKDSSENDILLLDTSNESIDTNYALNLYSGIINYGNDFILNDLSSNSIRLRLLGNNAIFNTDLQTTKSNAIFKFNNNLSINDGNNYQYINFNSATQKITFNAPLILNGISFSQNFDFIDTSNNLYLRLDYTNQKIIFNKDLDLSGNIQVFFNTDLNFRNKSSGTSVINLKDDRFIVNQPLILNNSLNFNIASGLVNYNNKIDFISLAGTQMTINNTNVNIKNKLLFNTLNPYVSFTQNLLIADNSNNLFFTFDISSNKNISNKKLQINNSIDFSNNSLITLIDTLRIKDISNNNYLTFDANTKNTIVNSTLDLSSNGNLIFGSEVNFIKKNKNVLTINNDSNKPTLKFKETLVIKNYNSNELYAQPLILYNIFSEDLNNIEKKYLGKTKILDGSGIVQFYFRNIIDDLAEQITFNGKIISRDLSQNSASFIFQGCTKYVDISNTNFLEFSEGVLNSPNENWKINSLFIYSNDLVLEVQSNQTTTTNWVISLESISV
jgi:hypothetical protein